MAVSGELYPFTDENISRAPIGKGVYSLHQNNETIYIGKAEGENGIRGRLQAHKRGDNGRCTQQATHYRREVCNNPSKREEEELIAYRLAHGRLPRCNEQIG